MKKAPHFAALSVALTTSADRKPADRVRLFPDGDFRAVDGRPVECAAWHIDGGIAEKLIADLKSRSTAMCFDYEHQALATADNGRPAPAAGWFSDLEWREGDGLYATGIEWTAAASQMIAADEYRYISPVFCYDAKDGRIQRLVNVALTNTPAMSTAGEVFTALSRLYTYQESSMDEKDLTAASASDTSIAPAPQAQAPVAQARAEVAPDPAKYVPIEAFSELQQQLAALQAAFTSKEADGLIEAALADRRLVPGMEAWARDYAARDLDGFKSYLASAPAMADLRQMQTAATAATRPQSPLAEGAVDASDPDLVAMCSQFGTDPATIAAQLNGVK